MRVAVFKISLVCSLECVTQGGLSMQRAASLTMHCDAPNGVESKRNLGKLGALSSISTVVQYVSVSQSYGRFSRSGEMQ